MASIPDLYKRIQSNSRNQILHTIVSVDEVFHDHSYGSANARGQIMLYESLHDRLLGLGMKEEAAETATKLYRAQMKFAKEFAESGPRRRESYYKAARTAGEILRNRPLMMDALANVLDTARKKSEYDALWRDVTFGMTPDELERLRNPEGISNHIKDASEDEVVETLGSLKGTYGDILNLSDEEVDNIPLANPHSESHK